MGLFLHDFRNSKKDVSCWARWHDLDGQQLGWVGHWRTDGEAGRVRLSIDQYPKISRARVAAGPPAAQCNWDEMTMTLVRASHKENIQCRSRMEQWSSGLDP
jgi:hypothetical protein